ncbi:ABC transporter permease [Brucella intermedia]|uniref:ABC transporter permease n=1 Tax=Brucella intermedia TaxID=94625 RepID=UPI00224A590F|nr:ABC transporter permease [Brucella intermedia]
MTTLDAVQERRVEFRLLSTRLIPILFLLPCLAFMAIFFLVPAVTLLASSLMTLGPQGDVGLPLTLNNYGRFFATPLYAHVLMTTLRISLITSCIAALLAYPVASVMVKSSPRVTRIVTLIILAPLVVSVVVRSYGWQLILSNSPNGILNWFLMSLGIINEPLTILYAEPAVIIGSLHVYFPMMVLPLSSALAKINPAVEEAARTLGGNPLLVFRRVIVPLSLPGLAAGFTIVFSLTAGSFVIPVLLGGNSAQTLGVLIEQQILAVNDWPFGAAISVVLVMVVMAINLFSLRILEKRQERR